MFQFQVPVWAAPAAVSAAGIAALFIFGMLYTAAGSLCTRFVQEGGGERLFLLLASIGTPVHELSHFAAALLFRHRITSVTLFSPASWRATGTLGCVEHEWNTASRFQKAGNLFIGAAPMLTACALCWLGLRFGAGVSFAAAGSQEVLFSAEAYTTMMLDTLEAVKSALLEPGLYTWKFWVCALLLLAVFQNAALSRADFQGAASGVAAAFILLCAAGYALLWLMPEAADGACILYGLFTALIWVLSCGLVLSFLAAAFCALTAFLLRLFRR